LGYYGPDSDSCWKAIQPGASKVAVAEYNNTFILIISDATTKKIIGRCWGFASPEFDVFNISNYYFVQNLKEANVIEAFRAFFAAIWDVESSVVNWFENMVYADNTIFHNPYGRWSFSVRREIGPQMLSPDAGTCVKCRKKSKSYRDINIIEGYIVCSDCVGLLPKCDLTGPTFHALCDVVDASGKKIRIKASLTQESPFLEVCKYCGLYTHEDSIQPDRACATCHEIHKPKYTSPEAKKDFFRCDLAGQTKYEPVWLDYTTE
jgi:hypothetical protein